MCVCVRARVCVRACVRVCVRARAYNTDIKFKELVVFDPANSTWALAPYGPADPVCSFNEWGWGG